MVLPPWSRPLYRQARLLLARSGLRPLRVAWRHRGLSDRDLMLASYPRSGNTWLRFLVLDVLTDADVGFPDVERHLPYVGRHHDEQVRLPNGGRLIKTHESYHRDYRRAVYVVRDVRSVVLSEHAFQTMHGILRLDLDGFIDEFLAGRIHGFGDWGNHVESWLDGGLGEQNLLLRFEDLRRQPEESLGRVLSHLGIDAPHERIATALERNTVSRMRAKEDAFDLHKSRDDLRHVNTGKASSWRERLTPEQQDRIVKRWRPLLKRLGYETSDSDRSG